ncbi:MAG TPA: HupE/UreJ family protein [Spongiibacteraceae bacterium]|nr:HupE/UreJ family protein [Spongiibacteraceae bacterium]HUH38080.1 HupE/UreJ family protein [Spongiibacteraceae bacterium]
MTLRNAACALAALLFATPCLAHGAFPGVNDFQAGMLHPLLVTAHLLLLIACGLLLGQQHRGPAQAMLGGLLAGLLVGLPLSVLAASWSKALSIACLVAALGTSLLVTSARPTRRLTLIGLLAGLLVGIDSAPARDPWQAVATSLAGTGLGALLMVCVIGGALLGRHRHWQRIGVRIVGAWIAAACLLVASVELRRLGII